MGRVTRIEPISEERIEGALRIVAYIIDLHGEVYLPIFERLENELIAARKRRAPAERARRLLESYTISGDVRAIR